MEELAWLDALAQAELVHRGEVSALELVEAAIGRVERLNPELNAVVIPMYDRARAAAQGELPSGPLAGVPFLLKDLLATFAGERLTAGATLLSGYRADQDSELVLRHKRAGLIIIGKTNTPEFGLLPVTEPRLWGPCRNPWDPARTPGGSSGGSAAAVAAGMVPMAHGNDGGGSIRIPASCCGLFGLKPTRARNSLGPAFGDLMSGLVVEHGLTRSVRDSAALLDATAGPAPGDPYWAPPPQRPFLQEVGADPGRLRIAFSSLAPMETPVHADCLAALEDAAALCAELGHEVEEASPGLPRDGSLPAMFTVLWSGGLAATLDAIAGLIGRPISAQQVEPLTWALYQRGRQYSASDYLLALQTGQRISRLMARFMQKYDLWLTPTLGEPPLPLGSIDSTPDYPLKGWTRSGQFAPFTAILNLSGQPAMSVPLYWNQGGLPIGVHFSAPFGEEATLFRLAAQLEEARPWAQRQPATLT